MTTRAISTVLQLVLRASDTQAVLRMLPPRSLGAVYQESKQHIAYIDEYLQEYDWSLSAEILCFIALLVASFSNCVYFLITPERWSLLALCHAAGAIGAFAVLLVLSRAIFAPVPFLIRVFAIRNRLRGVHLKICMARESRYKEWLEFVPKNEHEEDLKHEYLEDLKSLD